MSKKIEKSIIILSNHNFQRFCALCPVNKEGNFIKIEEKIEEVVKKVSLFNSKTLKNKFVSANQQIQKIVLCLFEILPDNKKIRLKSKTSE